MHGSERVQVKLVTFPCESSPYKFRNLYNRVKKHKHLKVEQVLVRHTRPSAGIFEHGRGKTETLGPQMRVTKNTRKGLGLSKVFRKMQALNSSNDFETNHCRC